MDVLISIQPYWCYLIASGCKTVEIRKNHPRLKPPFRCYIYMTAAQRLGRLWEYDTAYKNTSGRVLNGSQKVIGEFICDRITDLGNISTDPWRYLLGNIHEDHKRLVTEEACLTEEVLLKYGGRYAWHISNLVIYDQPKDLSEFWQAGNGVEEYCIACPHHEVDVVEEPCKNCDGNRKYLYRPPQSWCYVVGPAA